MKWDWRWHVNPSIIVWMAISKHNPALDLDARIESDLARGDLGMARERLLSRIVQGGYDPDRMAQLGRICMDMRDPRSAGRYWLLSNATGDEVDRVVDEFVRRCGGSPERVFAELPYFVRIRPLTDYPVEVQTRLRGHGLTDDMFAAYIEKGAGRTQPHQESRFLSVIAGCLLLLFVVFMACSVAVGAHRIFSWLF